MKEARWNLCGYVFGQLGGWGGVLGSLKGTGVCVCVCNGEGNCMINLSMQMEVGRSWALGSSFSGFENCKIECMCVWKGVGGEGVYFLLTVDCHTDGF